MFHSHLDGDAHMFTPQSTMDVQIAFGSDIMMVLDECLAYPATPMRPPGDRCSVRCVGALGVPLLLQRKNRAVPRRRCFPIVQGSMFQDLRRLRAATAGTGRGRVRDRRSWVGARR